MNIHESGEDYLETILKLQEKNGRVRSIDIARELQYSKPSVSRAMSILKERGLIEIEERAISLTEDGKEIAENIYSRHQFLQRFLEDLGVDEHTAEDDACRMEHIISEETFLAMKRHHLAHQNLAQE